jgi:hypothetical protein
VDLVSRGDSGCCREVAPVIMAIFHVEVDDLSMQ